MLSTFIFNKSNCYLGILLGALILSVTELSKKELLWRMVNTNNDIKLTQTNVTHYPIVTVLRYYFYSSHINADGDEYDEMKWTNTNKFKKRMRWLKKDNIKKQVSLVLIVFSNQYVFISIQMRLVYKKCSKRGYVSI